MRRIGLSLILLSAATGLWACGDDSSSDSSPDSGVTADVGQRTDGGDGGDPDSGVVSDGGMEADTGSGMTCEIPANVDTNRDPSCPAGFDWYRFVSGSVVSDGVPQEGAFAQVCVRNNLGNLLCLLPRPSCPDGTWFSEITMAAAQFRCVQSIVMRLTKPSGNFATSFCDIERVGEGILSIAEPLELYAVDSAPNKPPIDDPSQVRTVDLQDGISIDVTPDLLETCFGADDCAVYDGLGVRLISAQDQVPCFVDPANAPDVLYAFTAEDNVDKDGGFEGFPIRVQVPAEANLAAGTMVDLFFLGALDCSDSSGTKIEEGDWHQYGSAMVTADGTIEARLPCVSWFGFKAR